MSATQQRDQASALAKTNPKKALEKARSVSEPWFRAQALSHVARFTDADPAVIARQAAKAASECDDDYKRSAVRSWEVAALAERDLLSEAKKALDQSLRVARSVQPISSRSEALFHLLQAAFSIGKAEANKVNSILIDTCAVAEHWRCKRAIRDAAKMISGELQPRQYFW
ncbi:MAG: hypothetical protein ACSHX0_13160 [Akkermansiaceae bacterium]